MNKKKLVLFSVIGTVIIFIIAAYWYQQQQKHSDLLNSQNHHENLERETAMVLGDERAVVTVVEFFDPECESCRVFHPMTKMLLQEFEGKIKLQYRYAAFHRNSEMAIRILEASRLQNRYWEVLDLLFHHQPEWGSHADPKPELIWNYLVEAKIDIKAIKDEMFSDSIKSILEQDRKDVELLGVRMTPAFFVNGEPLLEFGYQQLRELVLKNLKN